MSSDVVSAAQPLRLGLGGDEPAPDAELAQAAADAAGVPGRSELRVEREGTAEDVDGGFAVGRAQFCAEVLERGRQLERPRRALEEIDRLRRSAWLRSSRPRT